jgi:hypothetical protein
MLGCNAHRVYLTGTLAVALLAFGAGLHAQAETTKPNGQKPASTPTDPTPSHTYLRKAFGPEYLSNWVLVAIGFAGTVAAVVSLCVLIRQTRATEIAAIAARDAADLTREALYLTESADVQWFKTEWTPVDPSLQQLPGAVIGALFKNFGRTTALNVVFDCILGIPGANPMVSYPRNPPVTLAANQEGTYGFPALGNIFDPVALAQIVAGDLPMRASGTVEYDDVFGRHHRNTFGWTYIPGTSAFRLDEHEARTEPPVVAT